MEIRRRKPTLGIPEIKDAPGDYGKDTVEAVLKYKSINGIVRTGQKLDPIVGRMTITRIDDELDNSAPTPPKPVEIAAPVEIATLNDNLNKDDLTFKPVPNSELSGKELTLAIDMRQKSTADLEQLMLLELQKGDAKFGPEFVNTFKTNIMPPLGEFTITHAVGSDFSNLVAGTQVFRAHSAAFRAQLDAQIKSRGVNGPFSPNELKDKIPPPVPSWSPQGVGQIASVVATIGFSMLPLTSPEFQSEQAKMLALIGSFQGSRVFLHDFAMDAFARTHSGTLFYQFIDHFGVDTSDIHFDGHGHGTTGQVAFWMLQHERHNPPGHMPFRLKVVIREEIRGTF
jgi:hypothetical protein